MEGEAEGHTPQEPGEVEVVGSLVREEMVLQEVPEQERVGPLAGLGHPVSSHLAEVHPAKTPRTLFMLPEEEVLLMVGQVGQVGVRYMGEAEGVV